MLPWNIASCCRGDRCCWCCHGNMSCCCRVVRTSDVVIDAPGICEISREYLVGKVI